MGKHLNGKLLALFALVHNATPFRDGKRRGKTPLSILGISTASGTWMDWVHARLAPMEALSQMHACALRASTIDVDESPESMELVERFEPLHHLDPGNSYYEHSNLAAVYVPALEALSAFHQARGDTVHASEAASRARALAEEVRAALSREKSPGP